MDVTDGYRDRMGCRTFEAIILATFVLNLDSFIREKESNGLLSIFMDMDDICFGIVPVQDGYFLGSGNVVYGAFP